jgi:hypothetical protein
LLPRGIACEGVQEAILLRLKKILFVVRAFSRK